jgi:hypothetical protein
VAVLSVSAVLHAADAVRVVPVVHGERVLITYDLRDGFTTDVQEAIASGLRTTFTYTVELRMEVPVWVDRTIDSAVVTCSDQYDNLTRRHNLVRTLDGRVEEAVVSDDIAFVRKWMTTADRLPLFKTSRLEANHDYYVRVSVQARPRGGSLLAFGNAASGMARFTFIP